jgi:hypothetical protein
MNSAVSRNWHLARGPRTRGTARSPSRPASSAAGNTGPANLRHGAPAPRSSSAAPAHRPRYNIGMPSARTPGPLDRASGDQPLAFRPSRWRTARYDAGRRARGGAAGVARIRRANRWSGNPHERGGRGEPGGACGRGAKTSVAPALQRRNAGRARAASRRRRLGLRIGGAATRRSCGGHGEYACLVTLPAHASLDMRRHHRTKVRPEDPRSYTPPRQLRTRGCDVPHPHCLCTTSRAHADVRRFGGRSGGAPFGFELRLAAHRAVAPAGDTKSFAPARLAEGGRKRLSRLGVPRPYPVT